MRSSIIAITAALALAACATQAPESTPAPAGPDARPVGGMLPPGSGFSASSQVDCLRSGTQWMRCDAGVVRRGNGNATVTVFWSDRDRRVIEFQGGTPVSYNGGQPLRWTRSGDDTIVEIGSERIRIIDAIVSGG